MVNPENHIDQKVVDDFYAQRLEEGKGLFGSEVSGRVRFESIARQFDVSGHSVADVGCGTGDLVPFLDEVGQTPDQYYGYDVLKVVVDKANERFDDRANVEFRQEDFLAVDALFDYVIAVSAFDRKFGNIRDSKEYAYKLTEQMIRNAKIGAAVTFLSVHKEINDAGELLFDPMEVFGFARQLTERVMIDHSYAPHAFTLFAWNEPSKFRQAWSETGGWHK